jgi:hypothetical protein
MSIDTNDIAHCSDIESLDDFDDLYQCGLARAQRVGQVECFTEYFDVEISCDVQEQRLIEALKEYLRPAQAPASLVERVLSHLQEIEIEEFHK